MVGDSDFDRYSRNRYGRGNSGDDWTHSNDFSRGGEGSRYGRDQGDHGMYSQNRWGQSTDRFNSQYSANDRYNSGGSDRWADRPSEDYRSLRDDSRFESSGSRSYNPRGYNEYDQSFDSNLGGRNSYSSGRKDWDYDRTSSSGYGSSQSSGYNPYGSSRHDSGQTFGTNYSSSGSQRQGYSGSLGQNSGYGSSGSYNQEYGRNSGNYNQGQSRWGSESSFDSKSGRGPKGYRRSDDRIKEEICDLLTSHHEVDPSEVEVKVSNCEVTLTGNVSSRQEKRQIEDLASQVQGVSDVTNQLRVQSPQDSSRFSSSEGSHRSGQSQGFSGQSSSSQKDGGQQSSKSIQ
jgi:osmotically-inducible protein OsmY